MNEWRNDSPKKKSESSRDILTKNFHEKDGAL